MDRQELENIEKTVLKPLIKRHEVQFKNLARFSQGKVARQTLVNYLQNAVENNVLTRREEGRTTYYGLNFSAPEYTTLETWLT